SGSGRVSRARFLCRSPARAPASLARVGSTLYLSRIATGSEQAMTPYSRSSAIIGATVLALLSLEVWGIEQRARLETRTGTLHGTLDLPNDPSPCPVVVIIA